MPAQRIDLLTVTVAAAAAISANTFIKWDGTVPASGDPVAGAALSDAASGDNTPVQTDGIATVLSGAAVTQYGQVQTDAAGKAIDIAAGLAVGRALDAATGAGELIRVRLIPN